MTARTANAAAPDPPGDWTRILFEVMDDVAFLHDKDGNILDANPAACRALACRRDELLRFNLRDIAPEFAARLAGQQSSEGFESRLLSRDGRTVDVDVHAFMVQGKPAPLLA